MMLIISFICPFFFLSNQFFCYRFLGFYESQPESSNFLYTLRVAKYIVGQKTKMLRFICTIFFHFSISHSYVIHREIFVSKIASRILKFGTTFGYDLLYCVKENQHDAAYHSLYLSIFLSLQ